MGRVEGLRILGRRLANWSNWPVPGAVALSLAAVAEVEYAWTGRGDSDTGVVLSLLATAPLALSRRRPWLAVVLIDAAVAGLLFHYGTPTIAALVGQLTILYVVGSRYPRRRSALALLPLAGNVVFPYTGDSATRVAALLLLVAGIAALWLGDAARQRRSLLAEHDATRQQVAEARHDQAVLAERARIARELHDVVAHHVSMMVVQAESTRISTDGLPPAGRESLAAIGETGRRALTEMRRLVGVLRTEHEPSPVLEPQPGLSRLDELVAAARDAGNEVRLVRLGEPVPLAAGVDLAAYRIIQEALTNVRRHTAGARVEVLLRYTAGRLHLTVTNDGPEAARVGAAGHGLLGMRERAASVGGTVHIGPRPGGGYLVEAELPGQGKRCVALPSCSLFDVTYC